MVEIIFEITFLVENSISTFTMQWLPFIRFENLNADIYVGLLVSIARFLYKYSVYSLTGCHNYKNTVIEVVNNVYLFLYIQIKCIFKCHNNFKFFRNQVLN